MKIQYHLSDDAWGPEEFEAAQTVLQSNIFTMGIYVSQFERAFAEHFGVKYAVMSNSGSSANLLGIAALYYSGRLKRGDEILVPAVSWSTTYFPLEQYGLASRFVDISRETLNMDLDRLEEAITPRSRAVMAVNLLGNPNDFSQLIKICQKYNLLLIEDNCESMGASYQGRYTGTFGIVGSFSTYFSHHLCTMEGGITTTDDKTLYEYLLSIRSHGWTRNLPVNSSIYKKNKNDFYESFQFIMPGYNVRPLEIEAAVGLEQLKKLDRFVETRRKNADFFRERLADNQHFLLQKEIGRSSWFGFSVLVRTGGAAIRDEIVSALKSAGVAVRPIVAGNFTRQPAFRHMNATIAKELKNADFIHDHGFFVGNHSKDLTKEIMYFDEILCGLEYE